jgi:hypothetical protein
MTAAALLEKAWPPEAKRSQTRTIAGAANQAGAFHMAVGLEMQSRAAFAAQVWHPLASDAARLWMTRGQRAGMAVSASGVDCGRDIACDACEPGDPSGERRASTAIISLAGNGCGGGCVSRSSSALGPTLHQQQLVGVGAVESAARSTSQL